MDYTVEDKQYDYLAKDFKKPESIIYRLSVNGKRFYYELENGAPIIYASGTTLISDGYPDSSKSMEQWRVKMRVEGKDPDAYANYRANYGTIMHILFGDFLMGVKIPLHDLAKFIRNLKNTGITKERTEELIKNNLTEFKKDLLAFNQFVKDYNVKPLAIEMMIRSKKYMVATAIDLVCKMDITVNGYFGEVYKTSNKAKGIEKGDPKMSKGVKTITALVDFKSGKKGFYDKHALQLLLNKQMMKENYPDLQIDGIYNFSPKDWKGTPSYNLKDQSENPVLNELEEVLTIGKKRHIKKNKYVKIFKGNLSIDKEFNVGDFYQVEELSSYITGRREGLYGGFEELISNNELEDPTEFSAYLYKQKREELEELASKLGVPYKTKDDFIKQLNNKYKEWQKKK